ncbi:MAG TPA: PAS domain-containing sensor histidine kinase, partial [Chryseosolibacter sp.]
VIMVDPAGKVVLYNNEAVRIQKSVSGAPLAVGNSIAELENPDRRQTVTDILKTVKRQKKSIKNFAEYQMPDGCRIFLEVNYVPVLGPGKELRFINIVAQDITNRRLFENKLRESATEVSRLLDNAHAVILSIDSRGYIVDWNHHCAQLTGFAKNDVLSKKLTDVLISDTHFPAFKDMMTEILKNQAAGNYEFSFRARDGHEVMVILSATPRTNAKGQVVGATLVGQDITELTTYRRSLEKLVETKTAAIQRILKKEKEAVEMKSRFVSIASHEFRTPLSSIDFAASFIKRNASTIGSKKLNEKVEVIEKHVSYMSHLIEEVLTYSKNETGKIRIIPSEIDLEHFIRDVVEEVICSSKHSHHICVSNNTMGTLYTDEKLLRNILINLLTNAIKFSPGKEEIALNVLYHKDVISIEVRDEGLGIAREEMNKIFQPFVRGKAVADIPGTGLGLSIVKKAVELLKGSITVQSTPGKGSAFHVTIPHCLR